jgi:hypothetical protein
MKGEMNFIIIISAAQKGSGGGKNKMNFNAWVLLVMLCCSSVFGGLWLSSWFFGIFIFNAGLFILAFSNRG